MSIVHGSIFRSRPLFSDLRATLSGKDLPEDIKSRLLAMHEENVNLKETNKTAQTQLQKARAFIKSQDKLFKEQHASQALSVAPGTFEEAETSFRAQIKILEEELVRQKVSGLAGCEASSEHCFPASDERLH